MIIVIIINVNILVIYMQIFVVYLFVIGDVDICYLFICLLSQLVSVSLGPDEGK